MGLEKKWIMVGRKPQLQKRERDKLEHRVARGKNESPQQMDWKTEGTNFASSCNEWCLKPGILNVRMFGSGRPCKALELLLEKMQGKQLAYILPKKQPSKECLGHKVRRLVAHLGPCPREVTFTERSLQEQINWQAPFPCPVPQHKHRATRRIQHSASTYYLTTPCTTVLQQNHPSQPHLPQSQCSSPRRLAQTMANTTSPYQEFCKTSVQLVVEIGLNL